MSTSIEESNYFNSITHDVRYSAMLELVEDTEHFKTTNAQSDNFTRSSYWLVNFLITTPPLYQPLKRHEDNKEEITDSDSDGPKNITPIFAKQDYQIDEVELPYAPEQLMHSHYSTFLKFKDLINPFNREDFIEMNDLISDDNLYGPSIEYPKLVQVLGNLAQYLITIRSSANNDYKKLFHICNSLVESFDELFKLLIKDEVPEDVPLILELFPDYFASLKLFLLLKDLSGRDFHEYKICANRYINLVFENKLYANHDVFLNAFKSKSEIITNLINQSNSFQEVQDEFRDYFNIRGILLDIGIQYSNRIISLIESLDLSLFVKEINWKEQIEQSDKQGEQDLTDIKNKISEEFTEEINEIKRLEEAIIETEKENQLLKASMLVNKSMLSFSSNELTKALSVTNEDTSLNYYKLEKNYPTFLAGYLNSIKNFTLARSDGERFVNSSDLLIYKYRLKRMNNLKSNFTGFLPNKYLRPIKELASDTPDKDSLNQQVQEHKSHQSQQPQQTQPQVQTQAQAQAQPLQPSQLPRPPPPQNISRQQTQPTTQAKASNSPEAPQFAQPYYQSSHVTPSPYDIPTTSIPKHVPATTQVSQQYARRMRVSSQAPPFASPFYQTSQTPQAPPGAQVPQVVQPNGRQIRSPNSFVTTKQPYIQGGIPTAPASSSSSHQPGRFDQRGGQTYQRVSPQATPFGQNYHQGQAGPQGHRQTRNAPQETPFAQQQYRQSQPPGLSPPQQGPSGSQTKYRNPGGSSYSNEQQPPRYVGGGYYGNSYR